MKQKQITRFKQKLWNRLEDCILSENYRAAETAANILDFLMYCEDREQERIDCLCDAFGTVEFPTEYWKDVTVWKGSVKNG